jgi:ribose 5-phosphate isomerase B
MKIGIAVDHGGFHLKAPIREMLEREGHEIRDFGAYERKTGDDFPDYVIPLSQALAGGEVERGIAICGSGVGACIAANKVPGIRAALIMDSYSAHQGVEDDRMNLMCIGGRVLGVELAKEYVGEFIRASFKGEERFLRRLAKIKEIEFSIRKNRSDNENAF